MSTGPQGVTPRKSPNVEKYLRIFYRVQSIAFTRVFFVVPITREICGFVVSSLDRLCGLVVRVLGYRSGGPGSIPGTTRKNSSGSGTGSTQPREYN
jgi:hypothetical protein